MDKRTLLFTILKLIMMVALSLVLIMAAVRSYQNRQRLDYFEHLNDTVVTIDGEDILFRDLAFYILYEECKVEQTALVYNPKSSKDYWNAHIDGMFVQGGAKDCILEMAIHDRLYYQLAVKEEMVLNESDEKELLSSTNDFWEDLFDIQYEKLPCSKEEINEQIAKAALAQKYMYEQANAAGKDWMAFNYDGYFYKQEKENHQITINKKLWNRLVVGDITLEHSRVNYINGVNGDDEE